MALAGLLATGCVRHDGAWARAADPATDAPGARVSLVLVGGAGAPTHWAREVGARLETALATAHAAGREPIVLWLGGLALPRHPAKRRFQCPDDPAPGSRPGPDAIAAAVAAHVARGHASYATPGVADWACGDPDALLQASPDAGPNPWSMPAHNYVVRVMTDGTSAVVSRCDTAGGCTIETQRADAAVLVELVVTDLAGWIAPDAVGPASPQRHADTRELDALLAALPRDAATPPRLLVSAVPVEAAGYEGMGGGGTRAAFHYLPPTLQDAVAAGVFAGVVAGHDRALYATHDITPAAKRSSRAWLAFPVFQVVAGSASLPDARAAAGYRRFRYTRANNGRVGTFSDHAGFAVVHLREDGVTAILHARRRRRWETAAVRAPWRPTALAAQTASPVMTPCQDCGEIPANER